jgi:hypothetical protein
MTKAFLISVSAAALIAASGCAFAQGSNNAQSAPADQQAPAATKNAPAEKIAPTMKRTEAPDTKANAVNKMGQAEPKGPADVAAPKRAEGDVKKDDTKANGVNKMGQAEPKGPADVAAPKHAEGVVKKDDTKANAIENKGAENKPGVKTNDKAASEINTDKSKAASDVKAGVTIGQAAAGPKMLTTEQRAKIRTVVKEQKVQSPSSVNFAVSVGTIVPRSMTLYPVTPEFITINREWRGFEYFLIGDQIVIVNPRTLEIVAVVEA